MQGRKHQMTGQRIGNRRRHRFAVTDFADQDAIGRLPQRVFQTNLKGQGVAPDLALVDDRFLVAEQEFDRILDGQDVTCKHLVTVLQHGGQSRALAGPGGSHHQDQTVLFHDQRAENGRHVQAFQRRDDKRNAAQDSCHRAALLERAEAKTADARQADAHVEFAGVVEFFKLARAEHFGNQLARLGRRQRLIVQLQQLPVDLDQDGGTGRQVDIRRGFFRHQLQHALHVSTTHVCPFSLVAATVWCVYARNKSLMLVLERVCASTRLTITAQYRLYLPSALGRLPLTTTEPDGMRP